VDISRVRQEQQAAAQQAALQQIADYNKAPLIPVAAPAIAFNPQPTLPLQSPIAPPVPTSTPMTPLTPVVAPTTTLNQQPILPLQSPTAPSIPTLTPMTPAVSPGIAFNPQPTLQSSKASPTPSSTPITPFPLLSVNPNVFVEALNPYAGGLPPSLAKTPIVEETMPPTSPGKKIPQLVRLPA